MSWNPERIYTARIGGVFFRNVAQPIVYGGRSLISLSRDSETGRLGVSLELVQQDQTPIASVIHSDVILHNAEYMVLSGFKRDAIIEKRTGRVWCEIREPYPQVEFELDISCILITETGIPIFLHPNRSKFGVANIDQPPNIASLAIRAPEPGLGAGLTLYGSAYLIDVSLEEHHIGVSVSVDGEQAHVDS